jgi:predicted MPP superfamily phosphohydrolase
MGQFPVSSQHGLTRRRVLKAGLLGGLGLAVYSGELERHWLETTQVDMPLPGLPPAFDGMRLAQISDIHLDEFTEPFFLRHVVNVVNTLQPDLVLLTGDFVSEWPRNRKFARGAAWQCAEELDRLVCRQRYAVMGNHDVLVGKEAVMEALTAHRVTVLDNDHVPIERGAARWWLTGVDDPLAGEPNPDVAIPDSIRNQKTEPVVLMCHGPDFADALIRGPAGQAVSLMLSGHTHGGQVRLPFLTKWKLPEMGRKYVQGSFQVGPIHLYVNRGVGTVGIPFRLACPPEITVFTLRSDPSLRTG